MTEEQHRGAAAIVAAVRRYGSDADHLRDAAHEACHALEVDVPRGEWFRDRIHDAIVATHSRRSSAVTRSLQLAGIIRFEITARAVERLVCAKFDIDIGNPEHWAAIACLEASHGIGINLPSTAWLLEQIDTAVTTDRVKTLVDRVIALGDEKLVKTVKPVAKRKQRA